MNMEITDSFGGDRNHNVSLPLQHLLELDMASESVCSAGVDDVGGERFRQKLLL